MPTTYAHNLFGKMVYHKLAPEIRQLLDEHEVSYIIGLHGPDILFYTRPFHKNKVNALGQRLHAEVAAPFFEHGKRAYRAQMDDEMLAYLLGFVCHFMLDSTCHPYISAYMAGTKARHDEIETEFDRMLMESTGKNPFTYRPSSVIRIRPCSVRAIARTLDTLTEKEIAHTLRAMKFYTNAQVCSTPLKRRVIWSIAKTFGISRFLSGRIILKYRRKNCLESTEELKKLFHKAVPETVAMVESYYRSVIKNKPLDQRFQRNYK